MALTSEHVQLLESMQVDGSPPVYEEDGLCIYRSNADSQTDSQYNQLIYCWLRHKPNIIEHKHPHIKGFKWLLRLKKYCASLRTRIIWLLQSPLNSNGIYRQCCGNIYKITIN